MRDPAHYIKPLKTTRTPKRLLWLDCHAQSSKERGAFVERWHVGALGTTHYTSRKGERVDTLNTYDEPLELWQQADAFCTGNRRVVMFAYDLAYQLRVSQGMVHLPALGWKLDRIVLERTASWALFRDDTRSLMMCDLKSWAPVELGRFAADVVGDGETESVLLAGPNLHPERCRWHVTVVRRATLQILDWLNDENLGGFKPTGSGQSYSAYRRRFMEHQLLAHDDEQRIAIERQAMWTGRCEAWRHGQLRDGPYVEYDMQAAYCRIASECEVPIVAVGGYAGNTVAQLEKAMSRYAVMAECTITTDIPVVPCRLGNHTVWPVGTFDTVLWDPEIRLAMQYAKDFRCKRAWRYHRAPALREFAAYVLRGMEGGAPECGRVPARVLKHWSRCLVGRLGLHFRTWEEFGYEPNPDLRLVTFADWEAGTQTDMLIAGHQRLILADTTESTDSMPQIPGYVMSECRRRLWEAMAWVGFDHLVYCDTDSIVFEPGTDKDTRYHYEQALPGEWTHKGIYNRMHIYGPRNLTAESTRRVAGLPLTARQVAPLEFTGQVMRGIKESMRAGELDCVSSLPRKFILDAPDMRRRHLAYGATAPFRITPTTHRRED